MASQQNTDINGYIPTLLSPNLIFANVEALELFLTSIRSPETRTMYSIYFRRYHEFLGHDLFCQNNPKLIEQKIIEFIVDMRNKG